MRACEILQEKGTEIVTVQVTDTLADVIDVLASRNIGAVVVESPTEPVAGILSERDVVRVLSGAATGFRETAVSEVMTKKVFTCGLDASVDDLLNLMTERRIRHVPICDNGVPVGMLSIGDVVKHRMGQAVAEAETLKSYIAAG